MRRMDTRKVPLAKCNGGERKKEEESESDHWPTSGKGQAVGEGGDREQAKRGNGEQITTAVIRRNHTSRRRVLLPNAGPLESSITLTSHNWPELLVALDNGTQYCNSCPNFLRSICMQLARSLVPLGILENLQKEREGQIDDNKPGE